MAFEGHPTDLSDPVTPRKGPALVAVVAADALLGPLLRPEGELLVVGLRAQAGYITIGLNIKIRSARYLLSPGPVLEFKTHHFQHVGRRWLRS